MPLASPKVATTRLSIPIGLSGQEPANAQVGTLGYATDTDKVRVQTSTGWQDIGGGAGAIVDIDSPDNSVIITNPGGPVVEIDVNPDAFVSTDFDIYGFDATPQLIDRMVTNDFAGVPMWQCKYILIGTLPMAGQANGTLAATSVTGITESSGPTALSIGAISSGQVLMRSGATVIGAAVGTPTGNPFIDPPVTAGPLDDEFESGSADLAARGWTVKNSAGTTMTRLGDITPWTASGLSTSQYRATIVGSVLHVQVADGTDIRVYKSVAWSSGGGNLVWARLGGPKYTYGSSTSANYAGVYGWYSSGGNTDTNNRLLSHVYASGTGGLVSYQQGRVTGGATSLDTFNVNDGSSDIFGLKLRSGTTDWDCFRADSKTGAVYSDPTGVNTVASTVFVGFSFVSGASGTPSDTTRIFTIDFFRSASGSSAWIGQTPRPVAWNAVNADITSYSAKAVPVAEDQVYIADSAASNAIKRATLSTLPAVATTVLQRNPYLEPSVNTALLSEEFLTDPIANSPGNGWLFTAPATYDGGVSGFIAPAATHFRATQKSSVYFLQPCVGGGVSLYRAVSGINNATGSLVTCRILMPWYAGDATTRRPAVNLSVCVSTGGFPDYNNRVYASFNTGTKAVTLVNVQGGTYSNQGTVNLGQDTDIDSLALRLTTVNGLGNMELFAYSAVTGSVVRVGSYSSGSTNQAAIVMFEVDNLTQALPYYQIVGVDFLRVFTGATTNWIL